MGAQYDKAGGESGGTGGGLVVMFLIKFILLQRVKH